MVFNHGIGEHTYQIMGNVGYNYRGALSMSKMDDHTVK